MQTWALLRLWRGRGRPPQVVRPQFMREVFVDALSFGGACMIRRLVGMAHAVDMDAIQPPDRRCANKCTMPACLAGTCALVQLVCEATGTETDRKLCDFSACLLLDAQQKHCSAHGWRALFRRRVCLQLPPQ